MEGKEERKIKNESTLDNASPHSGALLGSLVLKRNPSPFVFAGFGDEVTTVAHWRGAEAFCAVLSTHAGSVHARAHTSDLHTYLLLLLLLLLQLLQLLLLLLCGGKEERRTMSTQLEPDHFALAGFEHEASTRIRRAVLRRHAPGRTHAHTQLHTYLLLLLLLLLLWRGVDETENENKDTRRGEIR